MYSANYHTKERIPIPYRPRDDKRQALARILRLTADELELGKDAARVATTLRYAEREAREIALKEP